MLSWKTAVGRRTSGLTPEACTGGAGRAGRVHMVIGTRVEQPDRRASRGHVRCLVLVVAQPRQPVSSSVFPLPVLHTRKHACSQGCLHLQHLAKWRHPQTVQRPLPPLLLLPRQRRLQGGAHRQGGQGQAGDGNAARPPGGRRSSGGWGSTP